MGVRLHFIVEGQTEEAFVNQILKPHLANKSVWADARCVTTSTKRNIKNRGGVTTYSHVKDDIDKWRKEDQNSDARFTTMIDLYGLPKKFQGYQEAMGFQDPYQRVDVLEDALSKDINDWRFIPYIQLHEFEALILADPQKLETQFLNHDNEIQRLIHMTKQFDSPELINQGNQTAPSKRIINEIPEYYLNKVLAVQTVARNIGLDTMRAKCKHFNQWLNKLEQLAQE